MTTTHDNRNANPAYAQTLGRTLSLADYLAAKAPYVDPNPYAGTDYDSAAR